MGQVIKSPDIEDRTPEWFRWRDKGIGASDTPIILGLSEYKTCYELWLEKTGQVDRDFKTSPQAERGIALEPIARERYEMETGNKMEVIKFEMENPYYMRASLDGWNAEKRIVLEIKCPKAAHHKMATEGKVPEVYFWQMQHQMLVASAVMGHYYSFDGEDGVLVEVPPDFEAQEKILKVCGDFWLKVVHKDPPPLTAKDFHVTKEKSVCTLTNTWVELKKHLEVAKRAEKEAREKLIAKMKHQNNICEGVKIQQIIRKGDVQYKMIPELEGVDLDKYRKDPTTYWKLTLPKGSKDG